MPISEQNEIELKDCMVKQLSPIEIQFNTLYDRQLNNWLHDYLYKKDYPESIGQKMRQSYEDGKIRNVDEFEEVLQNVLSGC